MLGFIDIFFGIILVFLVSIGTILFLKGTYARKLEGKENELFRGVVIQEHRDLARVFLIGVVCLLFIAEIKVQLSEPSERGWLFYIHLSFAAPGLVMLLLTYYRFNGLKTYRYKHSRMAKRTLILIGGTLLTGFLLFLKM